MSSSKYSDLLSCTLCNHVSNSVNHMAGHMRNKHGRTYTQKQVDQVKGELNIKKPRRYR